MAFQIRRIKNKIFFYLYSFSNLFKPQSIIFISEPDNWIIKEMTIKLVHFLNKIESNKANWSFSPLWLKNKTIHFSSLHVYTSHRHRIHSSNKIIISWFHINDRPIEKEHAQEITSKNITVATSCQTTKKGLIKLGLKPEQIIVIPLGINLDIFKPTSTINKTIAKQKLNLPSDKIIIGSFQKDGNGWEDGLNPKLVKGPDVFCDAVIKLSQQFPIHVLLTGPARGYVKQRLDKANISYTHKYLKEYNNIIDFYYALDLYLITARVEGGPMAILESWATGTPLVSTQVGMVNDIATNNKDTLLVDVEAVDKIVSQASKIITDKKLADKLTANALQKIPRYSWPLIAKEYNQKLYS